MKHSNPRRSLLTLFEKHYPDPFVIAIVLTLLSFFLAYLMTESSAGQLINAWGDGLPKLLTFTAQLSLTLLSAHVLAHTDAAQEWLEKLARVPQKRWTAYSTVALISGVSSLISWALGLIVGAIVARHIARSCAERNIQVHYPLLIAAAYAGFSLWHMGYSSSAALFVATPGHSLESVIGIIPITDTVFTWSNGLIALTALAAIVFVSPLMHPRRGSVLSIDIHAIEQQEALEKQQSQSSGSASGSSSKWLNVLLGLLMASYLANGFYENGFFLTLDVVNWSFISMALLLARSPQHFMQLVTKAASSVGPLLIQYPIYAGILGLMSGSGLIELMSAGFANVATESTLGLFAFLSAGLVNIFIPSGGAQWAIQGPIFISAAQELGVSPEVIVLAIAYGDQWTNMIQPFWTIPLLAIAGMHMRHIMGYAFIIFLITMVIFGGGILLMGSGV